MTNGSVLSCPVEGDYIIKIEPLGPEAARYLDMNFAALSPMLSQLRPEGSISVTADEIRNELLMRSCDQSEYESQLTQIAKSFTAWHRECMKHLKFVRGLTVKEIREKHEASLNLKDVDSKFADTWNKNMPEHEKNPLKVTNPNMSSEVEYYQSFLREKFSTLCPDFDTANDFLPDKGRWLENFGYTQEDWPAIKETILQGMVNMALKPRTSYVAKNLQAASPKEGDYIIYISRGDFSFNKGTEFPNVKALLEFRLNAFAIFSAHCPSADGPTCYALNPTVYHLLQPEFRVASLIAHGALAFAQVLRPQPETVINMCTSAGAAAALAIDPSLKCEECRIQCDVDGAMLQFTLQKRP